MTQGGGADALAALVPEGALRRRGAVEGAVPIDAALYRALDDETRELLAADLAATFVALHRVDPADATAAGAPAVPPTDPSGVFAALAGCLDPPLLAASARVLSVAATSPDDALVFGAFDAGPPLSFDAAVGRLASNPDPAAGAVGPLHRDLASACAVSPELAARVVRRYRALTRRTVVLERVFTHHTVRLCAAVAAAPGASAVWALSDFLAAVSLFRGDSLAQATGAYRAAEAARGRALARILNAQEGKTM